MNDWTETTNQLPDYGIPVLIRCESIGFGSESFTVAYRLPEECDGWDWITDHNSMTLRTSRVTHWRQFDGPKID